MRTTLVVDEGLIAEARRLSGVKTKKELVENALKEFIRRRKARKLLDLEGKVDLDFTLEEFLKERKKDVPRR